MVYLLLLFVAGRCLVPMDETDLFFNLRLGEIIISTGHVPTENLLSFTYPAATDINLAWLFQIVLALVHRAAGIPGTVLLKTGFVLGTWAVLFRVAVRRGAHPALAALGLALAAWSAEPRFVERPHLVTFLGWPCCCWPWNARKRDGHVSCGCWFRPGCCGPMPTRASSSRLRFSFSTPPARGSTF